MDAGLLGQFAAPMAVLAGSAILALFSRSFAWMLTAFAGIVCSVAVIAYLISCP